MINYYVDPGSGFIFTQGASLIWGLLLGLFGSLLIFINFFLRFLKKFFWCFIILLALFLIIGGLLMVPKEKHLKKVMILGIDAMDPEITEKLMREGRMPNFAHLKETGAYSHLNTTVPSESIVAWTSFATGLSPVGHGVFDFIMRNPDSYIPYLSLNEIYSLNNRQEVRIRRKAEGFWTILSRNKIPSLIYFCPNTFPPDNIYGKMLSGMGVPDITGTMGRYSFYSTKRMVPEDINSKGKIVEVVISNNAINTEIYGPKIKEAGFVRESSVPLKIKVSVDGKSASFELQGQNFSLNEGSWSNWQKTSFSLGLFRKVHGIAKFYLKSISPNFELYLTPINFDPRKPLFPISYPKNYANKISHKAGLYYTQGMPYDTWALVENRLDEKAFLELADDILKSNERIFEEGLKEFKGGVFFFYLETLDMIQHMFWRYIDPKHPLYEENSIYKDTIFRYYEKMDHFLGKILKDLDPDTELIILSDHGFSSYRRSVHLNRWLLENGYLVLNAGMKEGRELLEDIDWSRTKAYALGFGGIYINKINRERNGIVSDSEEQGLKNSIVNGLKQLQDPVSREQVVKNVYKQEEVFSGKYEENAPDLFVGFNKGYRASWQTALGGVPGGILEDNKKKWSGDHLIDRALVPGVIFVNKKLNLNNPSIVDITPFVLGLFKIEKPEEMDGKELFK